MMISAPLSPLCNQCARVGHIRGRCQTPNVHLPHVVNEEARAASRARARERKRARITIVNQNDSINN